MAPIEAWIDGKIEVKAKEGTQTAHCKLPDGVRVNLVNNRVGGLINITKEYRFGHATTSFSTDQPGTTTLPAFGHKVKIKST